MVVHTLLRGSRSRALAVMSDGKIVVPFETVRKHIRARRNKPSALADLGVGSALTNLLQRAQPLGHLLGFVVRLTNAKYVTAEKNQFET